MTHTDETGSVETSHREAPVQHSGPYPPEIPPQFLLKWGLALLGEERAKQYLDWLRTRLEQCAR